MIAHHATMARKLGEELGLSDAALDGTRRRPTSSGTARAGRASSRARTCRSPRSSRSIGELTEVAHRIGGVDAAKELVRKQSGKQFDPNLADEVDSERGAAPRRPRHRRHMERRDRRRAGARRRAVRRPDRRCVARDRRLHRPEVAVLARTRARGRRARRRRRRRSSDSPDAEVATLRRAGLVHDFGRLGVSNSIWDKAGPLGAGEWERVRMARRTSPSGCSGSRPRSAPLGAIAVQHRERLDGSGYPHGLSGAAISRHARLLGAADAYQAMREPRPYRDALSADAGRGRAAGRGEGRTSGRRRGRGGARRGRPPRVERRREGPAGLTAREIDVLRHLARGLTNKDIAAVLVDLAQDRREPRRAHLHEDRRDHARSRGTLRNEARTPRGRGVRARVDRVRQAPTASPAMFRWITSFTSADLLGRAEQDATRCPLSHAGVWLGST